MRMPHPLDPGPVQGPAVVPAALALAVLAPLATEIHSLAVTVPALLATTERKPPREATEQALKAIVPAVIELGTESETESAYQSEPPLVTLPETVVAAGHYLQNWPPFSGRQPEFSNTLEAGPSFQQRSANNCRYSYAEPAQRSTAFRSVAAVAFFGSGTSIRH